MEHVKRKRQLAERLIKAGNHKKALKVLKTIQDLCNFGIYDEDKAQLKPFDLSSILNISLCHWKMGNWSELKKTCHKILEKDKGNEKALYRLALSEYQMLNYKEALQVIEGVEKPGPEMEELRSKVQKDVAETSKKEKKMYQDLFKVL